MAKGWGPETFRWLSLREVADGRTAGFCYHNDIAWHRGRTTRNEPLGSQVSGYPGDVQMVRIRYYAGVLGYWGNDVPTHTIPTDNPGTGGGAQAGDWIDTATPAELRAALAEALA